MADRIFGLIGWPVEHSQSPGWFTEKFAKEGMKDAEYRLFPLPDISQFPAFLHNTPGLAGLNVTIPHKEQVIPYLDELDDSATATGAVNVIRIWHRDGLTRTKGFNTDAAGFLATLGDLRVSGPALILGTGGAAKAVAYALGQRKISHLSVSRNQSGEGLIQYPDISRDVIESHPFIINATPLGMSPDTGSYPFIPYHWLGSGHLLYDLVYNPEMTEFLRRGKAMGAKIVNGSGMLAEQAGLSFRIFMMEG